MQNDLYSWHTYIVQCSDGTLYTGIAKNVAKRVEAHNSGGNGAKYTRSRRPVRLVYQEVFHSRAEAARREYQLKKMAPGAKRKLILKKTDCD